jgi:SNF2 family DNA or RNA helicase
MAPSIRESTKRGQLEALIASIPDDYDVHKKKTDKSALKRASMRFGFKMVTAVNGKWMLKGMKNALYHHQLLAADWMVGRELSSQKPHGGLLADAMGLGKTLEILATMVGNPPTSADRERKVKCTLIVLPSSVIKQWMDEIRTHVDGKQLF